jgi:hypothetical protein
MVAQPVNDDVSDAGRVPPQVVALAGPDDNVHRVGRVGDAEGVRGAVHDQDWKVDRQLQGTRALRTTGRMQWEREREDAHGAGRARRTACDPSATRPAANNEWHASKRRRTWHTGVRRRRPWRLGTANRA